MNITRFSTPIKALFSSSSINELARTTGFTSRIRGLLPTHLIAALCQVLGTKGKANLADIQRALASLSHQAPAYKPCHNQLKKPALTTFLQQLVSQVTAQLLVAPFVQSLPSSLPFERIHVHDGSTLKLHDALKEKFAGRFTQTMPAAIELHLSMDLISGGVDYLALDADKESERLYQPYAHESCGTLHLLDAGYFDIDYVHKFRESQGHCIIRAKSNINPIIVTAKDQNGKVLKPLIGQHMKSLKLAKNDCFDMTVRWPNHEGTFRLIASWDKRRQQTGYLMTTLPDDISAHQVLAYYGLRWQVELLFKELKSYCNLSTFATRNSDIAQTLIWGSVLVMLLKRVMAFGTAGLYGMAISTEKVQRSAASWLHHWVHAMSGEMNMDDALMRITDFLHINAARAHHKRDQGTLADTLNIFRATFVEPSRS